MMRLARELLRVASELMPRIRMTFTKKSGTEDRDLNEVHMEVQRFVSTLRKNEEMECYVVRREDKDVMELTVGFSDHNQMKAIVRSMNDLAVKLGKKKKLEVEVDAKNPGKEASEKLPNRYWAIVRDGRVVTSGNDVGMTLQHLQEMAKAYGGTVVFGDRPFRRQMEVGDILGYSWGQIRDMQQGIDPH